MEFAAGKSGSNVEQPAEVVVDRAEGDFQLPTLDEPADDLQRLLRRVGAEQRLRIEAFAGINKPEI